MAQKNRDLRIDILRLIAVSMIVLAHVVAPIYQRSDFVGGASWTASFIVITVSRLGVPIFFMISGYLLVNRKKTLAQNNLLTLKRLILPLIVWSSLTYIGLGFTRNLPKLNINLILSGGGTQYYFLLGLAVIYLINPILQKVSVSASTSQLKLLLLILAISTLGQNASTFLFHSPAINIFNYWFLGLFYFMYGQFYRRRGKEFNFSVYKSLLLFLIPLIFNFLVIYKIRLGADLKDLYLESYFGPTVMLSAIGLFNLIITSKEELLSRSSRFIVGLSTLSFGVYLIHGIILDLLLHKTKINPYGAVKINLWVYLAASITIIFTLSFFCSYLLSKNKYGRIITGLI